MIAWAERRIGGFRHYNRQKSSEHRVCHILMASSKDAEYILRTIKPYLVAKQKQAELGLKLQQRINTYRKEQSHTFPGTPLSQEEIEARERIYQEMRSLNMGWKWNKERTYQSVLRRQVWVPQRRSNRGALCVWPCRSNLAKPLRHTLPKQQEWRKKCPSNSYPISAKVQ